MHIAFEQYKRTVTTTPMVRVTEENIVGIVAFLGREYAHADLGPGMDPCIHIRTANGNIATAKVGDWVALDPCGHPYPITNEVKLSTFDEEPFTLEDRAEEAADSFLSEYRLKSIRGEIQAIMDDQWGLLKDEAGTWLREEARSIAIDFYRQVMQGNAEMANKILNGFNGVERHHTLGYLKGEPWACMIHGHLFLTDPMKLREKLVRDFAELLRTERQADLESIIEGLKGQIAKLEEENKRLGERLL